MDSYSKNSLFCENCNDITAHHLDEDWGMISVGGLGGRDPFYYECTICGKRTKSGDITQKQMERYFPKVDELEEEYRRKREEKS